MRRAALVAIALAGATVPAFLAALLLFGCCVLPLHRQIHQVVPLCHIAAKLTQGTGETRDQSTPAQEKQVSKKVFTELTSRFAMTRQLGTLTPLVASFPADHRSFITLGAVRCDEDVGMRLLLLDTLRI